MRPLEVEIFDCDVDREGQADSEEVEGKKIGAYQAENDGVELKVWGENDVHTVVRVHSVDVFGLDGAPALLQILNLIRRQGLEILVLDDRKLACKYSPIQFVLDLVADEDQQTVRIKQISPSFSPEDLSAADVSYDAKQTSVDDFPYFELGTDPNSLDVRFRDELALQMIEDRIWDRNCLKVTRALGEGVVEERTSAEWRLLLHEDQGDVDRVLVWVSPDDEEDVNYDDPEQELDVQIWPYGVKSISPYLPNTLVQALINNVKVVERDYDEEEEYEEHERVQDAENDEGEHVHAEEKAKTPGAGAWFAGLRKLVGMG